MAAMDKAAWGMVAVKRAAWVLVAGFALGLSWWSLAYVARSWGVPWALSWVVSAVFDGVALICAELALSAARLGDSTFAPASCLVVFAGLSAWFNSWHAELTGLPVPARIFYATPPLAAVVVTELQLRHDRRAALRAAGRVADPLPAFGGSTWLHKPLSTYAGLRRVIAFRQHDRIERATRVWPSLPVALQPQPAARPNTAEKPAKTPAARRPSPAGATARPRDTKPPAARKRRNGMDPDERAAVLARMRTDLSRGEVLTKRTVPGRYGVTAYHGEQLLAEARKLVAV
jgi:Protein of unknown function (DUF2637)